MNVSMALSDSINYLNSDLAIESIKHDPYWPKWDSPWWHMSLLYEMGLSKYIPDRMVHMIMDMMNTHYLRYFPIYEHELPANIDPYTRIPCHCQLGNMYQILRSKRADVDEVLPWIRPWFLRYQLPDGGLNCEDDAYRVSQKSSIASSLPVFESMMMCAESGGLSAEEEAFLDNAANYVIKHRLVHKSNGELMDPDFLKLQFPRFYSYDILRGLSFISRWRSYRKTSIADGVMDYGIKILQDKLCEGTLKIERSDLIGSRTKNLDQSGEWTVVEPASMFPLLSDVNAIGSQSVFLTQQFEQIVLTK